MCSWSLHLLNFFFFEKQKFLILMKYGFSFFSFMVKTFYFLRNFYLPQMLKIFSRSPSRNFIVLACTFRPMIHFELIFIYGATWESSFILLHVHIIFPASSVEKNWKGLFPLNSFGTLVENYLTTHSSSDYKKVFLQKCW